MAGSLDGKASYRDTVHRSRGIVLLEGYFLPNGVSAPTFTPAGTAAGAPGGFGHGVVSIVRTGVGTYTLTMDAAYPYLIWWDFQVMLGTAAATMVQVNTETVNSTKTVTFTILAESAGTFAAADIASGPNNRIAFKLSLQAVTVQR